jgi:amino acid permease
MKKLSNIVSLFREFLQIISYFVIVYAGAKIINSDSAEIKLTRNKIKRLMEKKKRLEDDTKKQEIKDKINEMVPKDKIDHFNDLLSKL